MMQEYARDNKRGSDPDYDKKTEKEVITKTEQYAAKRHGEIGNHDVTRTDHRSKNKYNYSPSTSIAELLEMVIKYNHEQKTDENK